MRYIITIAASICFITTSAIAEPLTLNQVIERSLEKSPYAARADRDYQDKLADAKQATTLENPELQADILRQTKGSKSINLDLELTQPLRLSQFDGTRSGYAESLTNAASTEQKYNLFKSINEVSMLYMKLWILQERKNLYKKSSKDAKAIASTIRSASRQGQIAVSESTLFTADSIRLETEIDSIEAEIEQTKIELTRITGFSFTDIEAVKPEFPLVPASEVLVQFSENRANLRTIVQNNLTAAEKRLAVADSDSFPEFGPRMLYSRASDGSEQGIGLGFALRIPLWDTNQAERQRAQAALSVAQADADSVANKKPEEIISKLQKSALRLQNRSNTYWKEILPDYRKSYDLSRQMLNVGQIPALDLWQVREKLYQMEEAALQSTIDAYAARLALELEIGGKLEEVK